MHTISLPENAQWALLEEPVERDRTTARRLCLLLFLWYEPFLTRTGLMARVEGELGKGWFDEAAWEDTFCRDMRVVKRVLRAAACELAYRRSRARSGHYLRDQPRLHSDLGRVLDGSVAEVDPAQIAIYRCLEPIVRFRQGCSISDTARQVVTYCLRQRRPELSQVEALVQPLDQARARDCDPLKVIQPVGL
jgi:hypothetical protein